MFSIGQLADRTGVKVTTIRFYESRGLMDEPGRSSGNQRRYDRAALDRLTFIAHGRELGLPLDDIAALIRLEGAHGDALNAAHEIASAQARAVQRRIARLQRLEAELTRIAGACAAPHGADAPVCAVLHALGNHDGCNTAH